MDIDALERDLHDKVYRIDGHRLMHRHFKRDFCAPHALAPRRPLAAGASGSGMQRCWVLRCWGKVRHRCRAHAACIAAPHAPCRCDVRSPCRGCENNGGGTPRARASAAAASAWLRAGPLVGLTPALKGAAKVRAVLASSRKRLSCAAGGASFSSPPSPPQGRYTPRYAVSAAVGGPVNAAYGQVAPASCWAASSFSSPVGPRNEPSLRFGLLALAPSALYR